LTVERLQKLLARAGYGSRRSCETIIQKGRVTVNGQIATLGMQADPDHDDIRVDGARLHLPEHFDYIILHKPRGVISDVDVGGSHKSARDLIPVEGHLYPVGRLDLNSEGLMLFTNDGDLAHKLTHPSYQHSKVYHVWVAGNPSDGTLAVWQRGVPLDGKKTAPAKVERVRRTRDGTQLKVTLREGRKRQIRRIASALGHPAYKLVRIRLGPLELGSLPSGAWRRLTDEEVQELQKVRKAPRRKRQPSKGKRSSHKSYSPKQGTKRKGR
jgi:23S rRNA pseudouridine2605 synthase